MALLGMSYTYPLLLGGLLAVGVPVALHLLLRQKPKTVLFPAFRFLVLKHKRNLTRLRLRHFLLLALRMLLIGLLVFALAQPKIQDNPWSLPSDQAVAAVFLFDTSGSMDYTITGNQNRLKEAQKRAVEMLKLLPANSEIVVLDSAERGAPIGDNDWLTREKAAERIGLLRVQSANNPVTLRLAEALKLLAKIAVDRKEGERLKRARVLCVFSDRTKAAWDVLQRKDLQTLGNQVPPAFERLAVVRAGIPDLLQLLPELRGKLPLIEGSAEALIERLQTLQERIPQARGDDYPDAETSALVAGVRGKQQDLLALVDKAGDLKDDAKAYRDKLQSALRVSLRNSAGFASFYIDVGIEQPIDLAVLDWKLERYETGWKLRVDVQATGEDFNPTLRCAIDGVELDSLAIEVKAGKSETRWFDVAANKLQPGLHQAKVVVQANDGLPIDNSRYLTYAVRRVLLLADAENEPEARLWKKAIEANDFGAALFDCTLATPGGIPRLDPPLESYDAVFLCSLKAPDEALWGLLRDYVLKGKSVGVLPPVENAALYNSAAAQAVLPGKFSEQPVAVKAPGADWNWNEDIFKHPLLHPFNEWKQLVPPVDLFALPRGALLYWKISPGPQGQALVPYAGGNDPAILERIFDQKRGRPGRVLLLTTPPGWPEWNNYKEAGHSLYVILAGRSAGYLTGDLDRQALNFPCTASGVLVPVPASTQATSYKLYREFAALPPAFVAPVTAEALSNEARVQQAAEPGNYTLVDEATGGKVSWFSVNLPTAESDLSRTGLSEIEAVLGPDAVLAMEARTDLKEAMRGHISKPWELFPVLMVLLLIVLAVENLLANRFYRREPSATEAQA